MNNARPKIFPDMTRIIEVGIRGFRERFVEMLKGKPMTKKARAVRMKQLLAFVKEHVERYESKGLDQIIVDCKTETTHEPGYAKDRLDAVVVTVRMRRDPLQSTS